jgi:hypothetical protein
MSFNQLGDVSLNKLQNSHATTWWQKLAPDFPHHIVL